MHHKIKTSLFKALEILPRETGSWLYHTLQRMYDRMPLEVLLANQTKTLKRFEKGLKQFSCSFQDKVVVEIGSGWLPVAPYLLLSEFQAAKVETFDINDHYSASRIRQLNSYFRARGLSSFPVDGIHPQVEYHANTNITDSPPPGSADIVISRNVLEHVPPEEIMKMHVKANTYLSPSGIIVHQISPSDHRAYSDKRLSLWDFLRYSQAEWDQVQTRFDYHNRLRLPHYLEIFQNAGYEVLQCTYDCQHDSTRLPEIIHSNFQQFSIEELTAGNIMVILRASNR